MPFNAMDFFNAGGQLGQANASPFSYGANSLMERFNSANDAAMKMALQKQLFTGEKNWEIENMPQQQMAASELKAQTGGGTSDVPGTASVAGSTAGGTSSGNPPTPNGNILIEKSRKMLNKEYVNPSAGAAEEQVKDTLKANQSFSGAMNMIRNTYQPMAGMHKQQGGGGMLPGLVGQAAQQLGSLPNTDYLGRFDTAAKDLAANTARQWSGSSGGVARLVDFFNSGGMPSRGQSEDNNLAILQQQAINNYSLAKAHGSSTFASIPTQQLTDDQIGQLTDAARNPGLITPDEQQTIKNMVASEYNQSKSSINSLSNPLTNSISGIASNIPYSGFNKDVAPKPNKLQALAEIQRRARAKQNV